MVIKSLLIVIKSKKKHSYFEKHSPLVSIKVTRQNVPQPDDDTMAAVKASIIDCVFSENTDTVRPGAQASIYTLNE